MVSGACIDNIKILWHYLLGSSKNSLSELELSLSLAQQAISEQRRQETCE